MVEIRKADINDAKIIAHLGRTTFNEAFGHLFREHKDLQEYLTITFSNSKIESSLLKPENVFWMAFWNGMPVGYAKLKLNSVSNFIDSSNICQLQKIYVLDEYLSMKIGLNLQRTILKEACNRNFEIIWLSVWNGNARAIKFYERNSFKKLGNYNFEIGMEKFNFQVMALSLNRIK